MKNKITYTHECRITEEDIKDKTTRSTWPKWSEHFE